MKRIAGVITFSLTAAWRPIHTTRKSERPPTVFPTIQIPCIVRWFGRMVTDERTPQERSAGGGAAELQCRTTRAIVYRHRARRAQRLVEPAVPRRSQPRLIASK